MSPYPQAGYTAEVAPLSDPAPRAHWQEWFSRAFVQSVASACGVAPDVKPIDSNQMDVIIQTWGAYEGKIRTIALQLKSTYAPKFVENDAYIAHDLPGERYNQLLLPSDVRRFLVIIAVPRPPQPVISLDCDVVHLQAAAWWGKVAGEPTDPQKDKRVKLPTSQRFDADGLKTMLLSQ
jgi:hypothetical protein